MKFDSLLHKSVSEIEGWSWNQPIPDTENASYEEYNFYRLYRKPLHQYQVKDLYFMIDQEVCLPILVSMALEVLSQDILIIAEDYEGDLLVRILRLPQGFWETNVDLKKKLFQILENNHRLINEFKFLKGVWEELKTLLVFFQNL